MPFSVLRRAGYVVGLLLLSGVLILAAQEGAQPKSEQSVPAPTSSTAAAQPASTQQTGTASQSAPSSNTAPSSSQGQQQAGNSPAQTVPGTVLKVTTRMVLVDVVATDKNGRPILDLKADSFEIKENGKPQTIR